MTGFYTLFDVFTDIRNYFSRLRTWTNQDKKVYRKIDLFLTNIIILFNLTYFLLSYLHF